MGGASGKPDLSAICHTTRRGRSAAATYAGRIDAPDGLSTDISELAARALSLEVRWISDGPMPVEAAHWFAGVAGNRRARQRVDAYWLGGELERSSVKVRAVLDRRNRRVRAHRTELKVLRRRLGIVRLTPHLVGTPELWVKALASSTPGLAPVPQAEHEVPGWAMVHKRRLRRRWPGRVPGTSTSIELTEIRAFDRAAWSVAAQARASARATVTAASLRPLLRETLRGAFPTWPEALLLGPGESASYSAWLQRTLVANTEAPCQRDAAS